MRDEDVVIKTERHGSERLLVWNVVAMVLVPSLLFSGHSALSVGLFIALGILAPINVVVYKRVWLDAPRFNTQKYFLALVPYLISLGIVCVGVASPSVTVEMMDGMEYFVLNTDNPSLITSSAISGTHAILGELEILAAAACALSIYFITESRFVMMKIFMICAIIAGFLALFGFAYAFVNSIDILEMPALGRNFFSTFPESSQWTAFALLWMAASFVVASYTSQRFSPMTILLSARFAATVVALLLLGSIFCCATPLEKALSLGVAAFGFAILASDVLPTKSSMRRHAPESKRVRMAKSPSIMIAPFAVYALLAASAAVGAVSVWLCDLSGPSEEILANAQHSSVITAQERMAILSDIKEPMEMRPLFGWGSESFPTVFSFYQGVDLGEGVWFTPKSDLMEKLFENGIVGLALSFATPLCFLLLWIFRRQYSIQSVLLFAALAAVLAMSVFGSPFASTSVLISFWVVMMTAFRWANAEVR